jgi:hypothetical protein
MRADMAKVIVERPRRGSHYKHEGKGYHRRWQRLAPEDQPYREGIKVRSRGAGKFLSENLAPLRRFLESRVGDPWDGVFAEICANVSRDSAVQDHVRDHVADFVAKHVLLIDGVPCCGEGRWSYGLPLTKAFWRRRLYVCPLTGLLCRLERRSRKAPRPPRPCDPRPVRLDAERQCRWVDGAWHLVTLAPLPWAQHLSSARDMVLRRRVSDLAPEELLRVYGARVYAASKRRLSKKEMRQLPIPIDQQGHV